MKSHYSPIPIINRMSSILDFIVQNPGGATTTAILHALDIPKTTLYRLLASMTENSFLSFLPETGTYCIGPRFTATYISMDERNSVLREIAAPHLQFLAEQVQETVKLSVLSNLQSYTIFSVEGNKPMRISINTGAIFPLHAGAAGKILLCGLNEQTIRQYYELYGIRYTNNTIITVAEMLQELDKIRTQGYATDHGEYMAEIQAVAAPIFDSSHQIIAAVSIAYPTIAHTSADEQRLVGILTRTCRSISDAMISADVWEHPARLVQDDEYN